MKRKKVIRIIAWVVGVTLLLHIIAVPVVYSVVFGKASMPDFDLTPGIVNYEEYKDTYKREEVSYTVKNHSMQGYYYDMNDTEYLIVTVHGIKDYADWLLAEDIFFLENGYNVFSFDMSGCGSSKGRVNGFSQPLIDMEGTLNYLNTNEEFKNYKKLLFGFSMGGYGVTSVLAKSTENVAGVVSISGYNDAKNVIVNKGKDYAGPAVYVGKPFVNVIQSCIFGRDLKVKAKDAIDDSNVPVFLAHGLSDSTIHYESMSIAVNYKEDSKHWIYTEDTTHAGILYSSEARDYQKLVSKEMKELSKDEKKAYVALVDDKKYSELNEAMFTRILNFLDTCKE